LLKCTNYEIPNSPVVTSIIAKDKTPAVKGKRGRPRKNKETGETGKTATQKTEEDEIQPIENKTSLNFIFFFSLMFLN
jgi:hypothetical protein